VEVVAGLKKVGTGTNTPVGGDAVMLGLVRVGLKSELLWDVFGFTLSYRGLIQSFSAAGRIAIVFMQLHYLLSPFGRNYPISRA
jgi:hypothetical protein